MTTLDGKKCIMTGAAQGVGLAIANRLLERGATVALIGKHDSELESIVSQLNQMMYSGSAYFIPADIRHEDQIKNAIEQAAEQLSGLDIVINNASFISISSGLDTDTSVFDIMHTVNARSAYLMVKHSANYLQESEFAKLLTITPPINLDPKWLGAHLPYTSSKYLLSMHTVGLAEELKTRGIQLNALWPKCRIDSPDICNIISGTYDNTAKRKRKPEVMADAAVTILESDVQYNGEFFIDEEVLMDAGCDVECYSVEDELTEAFID